jgi:hypothetical protein
MTFERAVELMEALAAEKISFTMTAGYHEGMTPVGGRFPGLHCRVDVPWPRAHHTGPFGLERDLTRPGLADQMNALAGVAREHGFVLESGIISDGPTFTDMRGAS